ncbi:MAG: M4 family metallopeptidase, partial [Candidatus Sumerlaeaceae bacterium]|nr:M4 family metallopeptidase [Candidatus Sumerlaeaceae bacterium]
MKRGALFFTATLIAAAPPTVKAVSPDTQAQHTARALVASSGQGARVSYHSATGKLRFFGTAPGKGAVSPRIQSLSASGQPPEVTARAFLQEYGEGFGIKSPDRELATRRVRYVGVGRSVVRFQQEYQGLPVIGGELIVHQDEKRAVTCAIGEVMPELSLNTNPALSSAQAEEIAKMLCAKYYGVLPGSLVASPAQLSVYVPALLDSRSTQPPMLVWQTEVQDSGEKPVREYVLVHALTGKIALHFNKIYHLKNRMVYDCNSGATLPGVLKRSEGQVPSTIADVNAAYDGTGSTYDFYSTYLGRDSIDGAGMTLVSSVRFCPSSSECPYLNAFWNGSQMVFGANMAADDVCAHELTHGVTERESGLFYYMQSGAINESLSDIFGEFTDLVNGIGNDAPSVKWQVGEDLPASIGVVRDMSNPGRYGQPDATDSPDYYCGNLDQGGVHTNSGVANKCAFLMVDGGEHNGVTVTPIGIAKTARIWYDVNCNYLTSAADFQDLYDALIQAALSLAGSTVYGGQTFTLADAHQVKNAAESVKMNMNLPSCRAQEAPHCPDPLASAFDIWYDDLENPQSGRWSRGYAVGGSKWYYPQNTHPYPDFDATYATSGKANFWGDNVDVQSDSWIQMTENVAIPTTPTVVYLHFRHAYDFEPPNYDGGVIEYSVNNGATWLDAGSLIEVNGYTGTLATGSSNPLAGKQAFCGKSNGYISTRLNLTSLKGMDVRFRFRIATDSSMAGLGWFIDDIRIYTCGYRVTTKSTDAFQSPNGWFEFVRVPSSGNVAETDFDSSTQAIRVRVSSDASRYRIAGWLTNQNNWLPYYYVGYDNYVRGKFYVYATGQSNPNQLNTIPNFRMRLANRFAVTSMLEVLPHSSATSGDEPISLELRPSTIPSKPSLYRVDFDPVDVPQLINNPLSEGITQGFEIYALDPQDNGYVCLTECSVGVYPKSAISVSGSNLMWLATYAPTSSSAGDLDSMKSGATLDRFSMIMSSTPGVFPTRDNAVYPSVTSGPSGITLDSTSFDNQGGTRVGVVQIDFSPDVSTGQRVRIEPNKQYLVRYHVTSTQQSNRNPQMRLRVRTCLLYTS